MARLPDRPADGKSEFARGWSTLLGAILGIAVGVAAVPGPAIGIFMRAMQTEFGWSRAEIALGPTLLILVVGLGSPALGWFADRFRPTWICGTGLVALAIGLYGFGKLGSDVRLYYAACVALAVVAAGAGTLPYARAISASFIENRGLALGLATIGTGLTAMLLPALLTPYVEQAGWRMGFTSLAIIVALSVPLVIWLIAQAPRTHDQDQEVTEAENVGLAPIFRSKIFWLLAVCFGFVPAGIGGLQLHFVSYLSDSGLNANSVGRTAALAGLFLIIGRIGTGWLVDRYFAPWVSAAAMAISAACVAGLISMGPNAGILGAIAIGLANGAEIDLLGFFTARYFNIRTYGRMYGIFYAIYVGGAGLSAVAYGQIYDLTGSYSIALQMTTALLATGVFLFILLGRLERSGAVLGQIQE